MPECDIATNRIRGENKQKHLGKKGKKNWLHKYAQPVTNSLLKYLLVVKQHTDTVGYQLLNLICKKKKKKLQIYQIVSGTPTFQVIPQVLERI